MDMQPSAMPSGGVSAGPLGHDYWKRAVYRAAPKHFAVEMLPPSKLGNSNCYGIRVHPVQSVQSSGASIRSSTAMNSSYVIWRKWEDCLWFQDTLELQYSMLSRQKRQRLLHGKGVKKNGVYIQDHASSWESLPPGPDPKSVKKDIHDYLPRLTKRGTLFRTSASTIDQRHVELTALVEAFLSDDVPALIEELREDRLIRDFFGFWRRDHDLLLKSNPPRRPGPEKQRKSFVAGFGSWSASFTASTPDISVGLPSSPTLPPGLPPSPTRSTTSSVLASSESGSSADSSSINGDMLPSRANTSRSTVRGTSSRGAPTEASFTSSRSRLVPNMNVVTIPPPSDRSELLSQTRSSISSSSRPRSNSAPKPKTYNVTQDFPLFLSSSARDPPVRPAASGTVRTRVGGLEALPEEQEHDLGAAPSNVGLTDTDLPDSPPTPLTQRRRAQSLAAASHRAVVVCDETFTQPDAADYASDTHEASSVGHDSEADPPGLSSSSATLSTTSLQSCRFSWRTGPRSRPSSAESTASGIDVDLSGFLSSTPLTPEPRPLQRHHAKAASVSSIGSADAIIPRRVSIPPSRRHGRPRSNSQPLPAGVEEGDEPVDSWIELGDDFMDAYFDGPPRGDSDADLEDETGQELVIPARGLDVPDTAYTAILPTPHSPSSQILILPSTAPDVPQSAIPPTPALPIPLNDRRQQVAISLSPDLFVQPLDDAGASSLQFPLPFTPPPRTPELPSSFPSSPVCPTFLATPPPDDSLVIKAARGDAIVSFRFPRAAALADARARVADKFAHTEGIVLASDFTLAYVPPVGGRTGATARETLVRGSTASATTADWSRQAPIACDEDWAIAVATCGHKLVLRVTEPASA